MNHPRKRETRCVQQADALHWRVVIDDRKRGTPFGSYVSRAGALATVRQLHAIGVAARVVPDNEVEQ